MADIASFPGSSGSPVILLNQGSYSTKGGIALGNRAHLLGILFGGPQVRADGTFEVREIPTSKMRVPVVVTTIPMHLGYYVKAKELNVLMKHLMSVLKIE